MASLFLEVGDYKSAADAAASTRAACSEAPPGSDEFIAGVRQAKIATDCGAQRRTYGTEKEAHGRQAKK